MFSAIIHLIVGATCGLGIFALCQAASDGKDESSAAVRYAETEAFIAEIAARSKNLGRRVPPLADENVDKG